MQTSEVAANINEESPVTFPFADALDSVLTETIPLGSVDESVIKDTFGSHAEPVDSLEASVIELAVKTIIAEKSFNPEAIREVFISNMGEERGQVSFKAFKQGIINGMMKSYPPAPKKEFDPNIAKAKAAKLAKVRAAKKAAKASKKRNRK
jgi:hypothetical protein